MILFSINLNFRMIMQIGASVLLLLFLNIPLHASGAAFPIKGKVIDINGEPLIGVSVTEKGINNATSTDNNGQFALEVVNENSILVFSYLGFSTLEVSVNGQSNLNKIGRANV